ncbi:MAG: hypothetical protein K2W96_16355 [Gemmataceae bacterium]|nr:hypothetical protein [Gemmataceae bacterium]
MPPRWLSVLIVAAWLCTTGWLVWSDVLPRLKPGTPPAFAVLLTEEADQRVAVRWTASRNGAKAFTVQTQVVATGAGRYELRAEYAPYRLRGQAQPAEPVAMGPLLVKRFASTYRVNGQGDLLGLASVVEGTLAAGKVEVVARLAGDAEGGRMAVRMTLEMLGQTQEVALPEADAPSRGVAVLMPLQPANRIEKLVPGQRWTVRLFDPLAAVGSLGAADRPPILRAAVRPEPEDLVRGTAAPETCLVIDYAGDDLEATTWVRVKDDLVVKQAARLGNDRWEIVRE